MAKDYYQILGVPRGASAEDIKKAFRKLAHEHHPDKSGGNEGKFKELNEAYQVLGNPDKRKQYDQFGANFESAGGPGGFNWQDFARSQGGGFGQGGFKVDFNDLGDIGDVFGDIFGGGRGRGRAGPQRGNDLQFETAVDFKESVFGAEKVLRFEKHVVCSKCNGSGAEPGAKITTCATCGGQGRVEQVQRTFLGAMRSVRTCPDCGGEGKRAEKQCSRCHGRGSEQGVKELKVKIPAGIADGQTMQLDGEGEPGAKSGPAGSLFLTIRVRPDKLFRRHGYDLITQKQISFVLAALGGTVPLTTLEGEVQLKVPAGTQ
ncbi:MAG: DnaJ C-terminal domain-containing protein, partial [Candidatus Veblenbacteria bacterium]|nr:DnaJ C-terminal domain-containing protein [Candidatus Veblenbacteria bacterium]